MTNRALFLRLLWIPLLHGAALAVPGSWLWGADVLRYLGPWGWASAAFATAVTAVLLLSRRAPRDEIPLVLPTVGVLVVALLAALLVAVLPDRTLFVGDATLRLHAVVSGGSPEEYFPQSHALDVLLHWSLPRFLYTHWGVEPAHWHRALGAVEAALLAWFAVRFTKAAALGGASAVAAASIVFFGGWLTLFTGLGKGFTELVLCTAAVGIAGLRLLESGRARWTLCLSLSVALLTHRSALALVPGAAWVLWRTRQGVSGRTPGRLERWAWLLPVFAIVFEGPILWTSLTGIDAANFAPGDDAGRGSPWSPLHALDLALTFQFLVPALVLFLFRLPKGSDKKAAGERRQAKYLWLLTVPFLAMAILYRPPQGLFRDFDGLAAAGVALALALAHRAGRAIGPSRRRAACAVSLWCALPAIWWLALNAEREPALRRVEALAEGPPERPPVVRTHTLDFLASHRFEVGDFEGSKAAFARIVELAPSVRYLTAWGEAARRSGDWQQTEQAYRRLLEVLNEEQAPLRARAHYTLATAAARRRAYDEAERHLEAVFRIEPSHAGAERLRGWLDEQRQQESAMPEETR